MRSIDDIMGEANRQLTEKRFQEHQEQYRQAVADNLGDLWQVRPESREWTADDLAWLLGQHTIGDRELDWLRTTGKPREPWAANIAAAVWQSIKDLCRFYNQMAWPFQVLLCLAGLFVIGYAAGWAG